MIPVSTSVPVIRMPARGRAGRGGERGAHGQVGVWESGMC